MNGAHLPPRDPIDNDVSDDDDVSMNEHITEMDKDMAAVKADVAVIRSNYVTQADLAREVGLLRSDMASGMGAIWTESGAIRAELAKESGAIRTELAKVEGSVRADLAREIGSVRSDMAQMETRIIKWFVATAVTLAGVAFAAARFIH